MSLPDFANGVGEAMIGVLPDGPRIALRRGIRTISETRALRNAELTVIAHPKSGSTWLRFQLARLFQREYNLPESLIPRISRYHRYDPAIPRMHMAGYEHIKHIIAGPAPSEVLQGRKVVFVVRHPLDVIVSLYFHVQKHATRERKLFNNWPMDLGDATIYDFARRDDWGLREAIDFYNSCARHAATLPNSMVVSYEEMRTETARTLSRILAFAGTQMSEDAVREAVEFTSMENLRAAEKANTFNSYRLRPGDPNDPESFKVRRGKIFGYRDYLEGAELAELEAIVESTLDPSLGYADAGADQTPG